MISRAVKWPLFSTSSAAHDFLLSQTVCYGPAFVAIVSNENGSAARPGRAAAHPQVSVERKGNESRFVDAAGQSSAATK